MSEAKSYEGSCHCQKTKYRVTTDLSMVISCNCSICSRTGALLTFATPDQFTLEEGADEQHEYRFGKKVIEHLFCSTCGIRAFARGTTPDGKPMIAINVRCLEGVDIGALQITQVDGKSR